MECEAKLKLIEQLVEHQTGKRLIEAEKTVFRGAWEGLTYDRIAEQSSYEPNYLKGDIGPNFWKLLTQVFGEQVNKRNIRAVLEKQSGSSRVPVPEITPPKNYSPDDWGQAPDVSNFCGRYEELATLSRWILEDKCRMVGILGLGGMGKTTLAVRMGQQVKGQFDRCIYRVLRQTYTFDKFMGDLPRFLTGLFPENPHEDIYDKIARLIDGLRQHRCLLILDNVEAILQEGDRFGRYREGFEDYGQLFKQVGEVGHQSCLVIISREEFKDLKLLARSNQAVRQFNLESLKLEEVRELLKEFELKGEKSHWQDLSKMYGGNPADLIVVAEVIQDFFSKDMAKYIKYTTTLIPNHRRQSLEEQWKSLSNLEKQVMIVLAKEGSPISFPALQQQMADYSISDLIEILNSLKMRFLLEKSAIKYSGESKFGLQPTIQKYIIKYQLKY